ncbi:adhesion G protein-coupled receptor L3-like [Rhipicephalus sanguineus]|uniref:adhesion G protein-coupled receptor L3-like n=1 Tax=Rhipicephalus sanguineus TaxID=34632 RepID=UPI0020C2F0F4|nr:adhesion G protein-coupled receptor L3-like [Rhipicephalus sanguineus]
MSLLPDNFVVGTYESLLGSYQGSQGTAYWLSSPERAIKSCAALVSNETTFILFGIDCSTKFHSLCVFDNPATTATITATATTVVLRNTYITPTTTTISTTIVTPTECQRMDGWPSTKVGGKATKPCGGNKTGVIIRTCEYGGHWSKGEDTSYCKSPAVAVLEQAVKESKNLEEVTDALRRFTGHVQEDGYVRSVSSALASVMEQIDMLLSNTFESERANQTRQLAETVVDLASATMQKPHIWSMIPERERLDTAAGLAHRVEDIFIRMIIHQYPILTETRFGKENITMMVRPVTQESLNDTTVLNLDTGATVKLPPRFLSGGPKNAAIIFSENTLVKDIVQTSSSQAPAKYPILATSFVTASILSNGERTSKINGNVTLSFKYNNALKELTPKCSFIRINANGSSEWSTEGCTLVRITENELECSCNHLTVFAVIMSGKNIVDVDDIIRLEWITKIGCGISIVCLVTCIVIFSVYRQLRGIRNTIHRNLCLSLLIAEIILLAGMQRVPNDWKPPEPPIPRIEVPVSCTIVAFLLHFFFLAAFGWMALEGCHIIVLLWKVFNQKRTYYERYYFAGYGIPLIIASITLGCRYDLYANRRADDRFCWIPEEKGVRYSFIGPVAAVILLNVGALCLVLWKMSHVRLVVEKSTAEKVKNWVRGTFILLPILGVTWLFGFLMLGDKDLHRVGAYLFTIFNCLQATVPGGR